MRICRLTARASSRSGYPRKTSRTRCSSRLPGNEEHQRPKFFAPYQTALADIRRRAKPVPALVAKFPAAAPLLDTAMRELPIPAERVRWLPVHHRQGFWTALIDNDDGKPVAYVAFDPYGD